MYNRTSGNFAPTLCSLTFTTTLLDDYFSPLKFSCREYDKVLPIKTLAFPNSHMYTHMCRCNTKFVMKDWYLLLVYVRNLCSSWCPTDLTACPYARILVLRISPNSNSLSYTFPSILWVMLCSFFLWETVAFGVFRYFKKLFNISDSPEFGIVKGCAIIELETNIFVNVFQIKRRE